jgi:hypothetical protein
MPNAIVSRAMRHDALASFATDLAATNVRSTRNTDGNQQK